MGKVPAALLQEASLDQLIEHGKELRSQREKLQSAVVVGRMPWLFAEEVFRNPPSLAWALHTQSVKWLSEEPLSRASLSIYATNGFTIVADATGRRIEEIVSSPKGQNIVVDVSALVTLHQLGHLETVADYCGRLLLPATYGDLRHRDADRFGQHQPSRKTELDRIRAALIARQIRIAEMDETGVLVVDEYRDNDQLCPFGIRDLFKALRNAQRVTSAQFEELASISHREELDSPDRPPPDVGSKIIVALSTLRALAGQSALEAVLSTFRVFLRRDDEIALTSELNGHVEALATRNSHHDLWQQVIALEKCGKIEWTPIEHDADFDESPTPTVPTFEFDAIKLARQLQLPIVADDRVLQVLTLNHDSASRSRAFGTDKVLVGLWAAGVLDRAAMASDFRKLMNWRYRFLLPPPELLFDMAVSSRDCLPGDALLDVASYFHDCLRDPGLLCGLEACDTPMPMAVKYVLGWNQAVTSFLADVWEDASFSDEAASQLTWWVGEELIPSVPRGLWYSPIGNRLAQFGARTVLQTVMVRLGTFRDRTRAKTVIRVLSDALGLDRDEVLNAAVEVLREI